MLISIKHRCIFIHIYKTGGTSIEHVLRTLNFGQINMFCDEQIHYHSKACDIINVMGRELFDSCFSFAFVRNPWDLCFSMYKYILREKNHFMHDEVMKYTGFKHYLKTQFYKHLESNKDFPDRTIENQMSFVCDNNAELLVDFVGRFENLHHDFNYICDKLGIDRKSNTLPHLNKSTNGDFRSNYDSQMVDWAYEMHKEDINFFKYSFE